MKHIAIVMKNDGPATMERPCAVTGNCRDEVITVAIAKREEITKNGSGPYRILIGVLTDEVVFPVTYEIKRLPEL